MNRSIVIKPVRAGARKSIARLLQYMTLVLMSAASIMPRGDVHSAPQVKALRLGRLWDPVGGISTDAVVVIREDRIASMGLGAAAIPAGAEVVDLRRYMGIPGLIDVHTHMTYYWHPKSGTRPLEQRRHPAVTVFLAQENARKTLETGVTTVRDLNAAGGMDQAMRDLIAMGAMVGPRMFVSGQGLAARGGPPGPPEMKRLAEERAREGADWVKLFGSKGGFDNISGDQTLSFDEMKAAVEAAHALGRRVAIHSYGPAGGRDAVRAGADSIEHSVDLDDETLAEMARRRIYYVPTIDHNRYYIDAQDEFGFRPESIAALRSFIRRNLETARRAHAAGVRFAMGSDAVYTMFGQNTRELGWFVKAGMAPEQALKAATLHGAELLGMQASLGRIAPGYLADIVAVEGNPLMSITDLFGGVRWVMKAGVVVVDRGR